MRFYYYKIKYRVRNTKKIKKHLERVIRSYKYIPGDLNFIFTNNRIIKKLNKKYLKHNYNTDVITFKFDEGKVINGEIYISIEKVKINAKKYNVTIKNELMRVIIHGILHMCGFRDYNEKERSKMKKEEDMWLENFEE